MFHVSIFKHRSLPIEKLLTNAIQLRLIFFLHRNRNREFEKKKRYHHLNEVIQVLTEYARTCQTCFLALMMMMIDQLHNRLNQERGNDLIVMISSSGNS